MSGECDLCGEHTIECKCVLDSFECECQECLDKWKKLDENIPHNIISSV